MGGKFRFKKIFILWVICDIVWFKVKGIVGEGV